jgi:starch synthase
MKGGITLADALTTVSPTYAQEIQTPELGCGLDGVLRHRASVLEGILNGVDTTTWDPQTDAFISQEYDFASAAAGKARNRSDIRAELGLPDDDVPLIVWLGRMVEQKGADLILAAQETLATMPVQIVILGQGDAYLEQAFVRFSDSLGRSRAATRIAYDERLAHRLTAGADILLMPSRYEPCGLNQMYAQRYGTLPVVRRTGGLADTVIDATATTLANGTASGVVFRDADVGGLVWGIRRALELHADPATRAILQQAGMTHDFSWGGSASRYVRIYQRLLTDYRIAGTG